MFRFYYIYVLFVLSKTIAAQQLSSNEVQIQKNSTDTNKTLTYKIINTANKTYCYDIFNDGKLVIHQSSIPGLTGNEGFKTKSSAEKVALLVISKIQKGEMPPSVAIDELKKLNVIP